MRTIIRTLTAALLATAVITPAIAQAQDGGDVIVMRRQIVAKTEANGAANGGIIGGVIDALTGPTYGWYNICAAEQPMQMCLSISTDGDLSFTDDASCGTAQSAVHTTFLATQSLSLLGSATALVKAGAKPAPRSCANPPTRGYGYLCPGPNYIQCMSVDSVDAVVQLVDASRCAAPQKSGLAIDSLLTANGLVSVGSGVTAASCQMAASAVGRKDECTWTTDVAGNRTMALKQSCYGMTQDMTVSPVAMSVCTSAPAPSANELLLLRGIGLMPTNRTPTVSCVNKDVTAQLVSKVVGNTTSKTEDGYTVRTIDYTFQCTRLGLPLADKTPCAKQIDAWMTQTYAYSQEMLWGLDYQMDVAAGTRREIYTDYSS